MAAAPDRLPVAVPLAIVTVVMLSELAVVPFSRTEPLNLVWLAMSSIC